MTTLTVALLQMAGSPNQALNTDKAESYCIEASALGADVALFPEMWNNGYAASFKRHSDGDLLRHPDLWTEPGEPSMSDEERRRFHAEAVNRDGPYVRHFRSLARRLEMAIAVTYLEDWPGAPRNSVSLIDRRGDMALTYAKVHTCAFDEPEASCTPGEDFPVATLDTAAGEVPVGAMICYDREFPEPARILMLNGAEIILVPNACELEENRLGQFRARASENMVGAAMANYAIPDQNGHSVAYDCIAFRDGRSRNTLVVEAGEGEGVYLARFDLDALRDFRKREAWGNAFRRPHAYKALVSPEVRDPFRRVNADGQAYPRSED